ncbi:hypothetical protein FHS43_002272 [Streptosporangium becharense]|uniref:Uncharacterized protein n=1 Tax=Streptosporangium becharense TaxID=1816182 RepID=A0A7W9MIF6_9ACTN|nr:hypothetical protein [Streptosporangium becharense]MBB2911007.1 hypothetical protein [Streptosporangium becharense]MBB5821935.1 hypothetical protein [Streptosporangium becharense]
MPPHEQADDLHQAVDELGVRIYTALRDGGLDAEPLIELACLMEEWSVSTPVTRELLERPAAGLTAAELARLGEALLDGIGFGPSFALEPGLLVPLEEALKVVERDVRAAGITGTLRMIVPDWDTMGMAWVEFEGICQGNGLGPGTGTGALWSVADATQEVVMEVIWRTWPVCPVHDRGLRAEPEEDGIAVWRCTGGGTHTVAPVGELPPGRC